VFWRAQFWGRKKEPLWLIAGKQLGPSNLSWYPQNKIVRRKPMRPRGRFNLKLFHVRPRHILPYNPPQPQGKSPLAFVPAPQDRRIKRSRPRPRFFLRFRETPRTRVPHAYVIATNFQKPDTGAYYRTNEQLRRRMRVKQRPRFFMKWLNVKPKHVTYLPPLPEGKSATPFIQQTANYKLRGKSKRKNFFYRLLHLRPRHIVEVDFLPQPEGKPGDPVMWVPRPTHFKLRGKSLRRRWFFRLREMPRNQKPPHVYSGVPPQPSNEPFGWQQASNLRKRGRAPRRRWIFNWKNTYVNARKAPHIYDMGTKFQTPSTGPYFKLNEVIRRNRRIKQRKRFFVQSSRWPQSKLRVRHYPFKITGGVIVGPDKGQYFKLNDAIRLNRRIKQRKRFRIMGKWPWMNTKMHIISYHVLPVTFYSVNGPGKVKKRLVKPQLDSAERANGPKLQK
jgi:hypothetical protein